MKKTYISIFCGLLAILFQGLLVSCDEHEPMDYGIHVGYVLCDDHSCMDTTTYFSQTSKKAVGVVFTEATEEHPAMAVMLNEFQEAFSDSLGVSQGTSMDIEIPSPCSIVPTKIQEKAHLLLRKCSIFILKGKVISFLA